ncbi:staphylopine-dependent metal ABC transporter substrate-binding lipoprotein [Marinicrinis sediminis]|uniref:Staphylopine-dependent metal ABC transporter substrate-binding lipoprotein n=1 Tax=Marinicrinis sediminis TaxID=1652465 RepID=A0ABW5R8F1_9BACL
MGASLIALSACSSDSKPAQDAEGKTQLVYATAKDIQDMNPHLYAGSMPAQGMVYESLVENTEEGIKPLLAESWEISEDGKQYTFHLREGVTFHDGEPFDAEAVKKNIEAVQRNAERHAWIKLSSRIASCEVIDTHTVQLNLTEPYYPTLVELSMTRPYVFLSPKDFVDGETKDGVEQFHGTGPYQFVEHVVDQYATFEANTAYWGGAPSVDRITAKVLPAGETTLLALQKGEINFLFTDDRGTDSIDVDAMNQLADTGEFQVVRSEPMNTKMIVANSSKKGHPIHEQAVREAIWHAIDRDTITANILNGTETTAHTLFASNVLSQEVKLEKREFDLDKAKSLLESAGWKQNEGEEVRAKEGVPLSMTLYYDSHSLSQKMQAEFIQDALKQIGFSLEILGEESTSIANRRATGDYDMLFNQTWGLAYDPQSTIAAFTTASSYLHTTSGMKQAEELYQKIEDLMKSVEEPQRQQLLSDILTMVHEEAVFIPISNGHVVIVAPSDLKGIDFKQTQYEVPFERMSFE